MKARLQPLNSFSEGQIGVYEYTSKNSKNVGFDCIMNAFIVEHNRTQLNEDV